MGFGKDGKPDFWISDRPTSAPLHMAFASPNRVSVDAFHREALAAGGRDNGPPGLRPQCHPSYYGAFVLDAFLRLGVLAVGRRLTRGPSSTRLPTQQSGG